MRLLPRAAAAVLLVTLLAGYVSLWSDTLREPVAPEIAAVNPAFVASDFFLPWYGARGLLAGKNPYDDAFHEELHRDFYGALLQRSAHLTDVAGFYYPPYVVVSLLPLVWLPFWLVRWLVGGLLVLALCASGALWTHLLSTAAGTGARARTGAGAGARWRVWAGGLFALLFHASISVLFLQQHSGFVVLAIVGAHVAAARRRFAWAGVLLALAMVKPQLALVPAAGLLFWALWRRERWPALTGFAAAMAAQLALSELLLPGWTGHFAHAAGRRVETNSVHWLPGVLSGGSAAGGAAIASLLLLLLAWLWWRCRALPATSPAVLRVASLGFAAGLSVVPDAGLYNRALLVASILTLAFAGTGKGAVRRATGRLAALVVVWPVAILGVTGVLVWMGWLSPTAAGLLVVPLQTVDAVHATLPVLLLPALAALCLESPRASWSGFWPGVLSIRRPAAGLWARGVQQ